MTTANEIAEIRQRNNNGYELWNDGEGGAFIDMQVYDDLAALLAIVDALTARAEAAEAALEGANRREQWLSAALRSIYWEAYDATNKEIPMRKSVKYSLVHAKAALNGIGIDLDALAAHDANGESAGNGGA